MSAYVPPHRRNKAPSAAQTNASGRAPPAQNGRWGNAPAPAPRPAAPAASSQDARRPATQTSGFDARRAPQTSGFDARRTSGFDARTRTSGFDARATPERYVSAYDAAAREHREKTGDAGPPAGGDDKAQYAKLIEFSRYRREELGQRRAPDDPNKRRARQSAPRAFGTNDHGRGMEFDEDLPNAARVDTDEGMVYETDAGACVYFCDRFRRYKFYCDQSGLSLLRGLVAVNRRLLGRNAALFAADADEAARQRAEGYALYEEKPNLRRRGSEIGTWSDREYGLPGFQWMYLRLKSYQRFTETWAVLERCAAGGLFDEGGCLREANRVVSLGGGPGYELLAYDYFDRYWRGRDAADPAAWRFDAAAEDAPPAKNGKYVSLDLQPSWVEYVDLLGYGFHQWDVHDADLSKISGGFDTGVVCMLSNIMCYCTDDATADLFERLLDSFVVAIVANERGAEQGIAPMMERRGVVVAKLLDQAAAGRDDRQIVFLPKGSPKTLPGIPLADGAYRVFPNVPYEEKKGVRRT